MRLPASFRRLQTATIIDSVGDGAFTAALPLLVASITRDPTAVALVAAVSVLPWLLLSLPAGAFADRHDRIRMMWGSQFVQAAIVSGVAALAAFRWDSLGLLAVLAATLGVCEVVFGIASQSVLPQLVDSSLLHRANGRQTAVMTAGSLFVGPPFGSFLFSLSRALPFVADAVSFLVAALLVRSLPRLPRLTPARGSLLHSIREGIGWLGRDPLLRVLALMLGINNFAGQFGSSTLVLLATGTLRATPFEYGVMLTGTAVGATLGGLVNDRIIQMIGERAAMVIAIAGLALAYLGVGLSPNPLVLAAFLAVNGFLVTMWNIVTVTLRQRIVPIELLGRVNSAYRTIGWGLMPIGAFLGGLVAAQLGLRAPYLVAFSIRAIAFVGLVPLLLRASRDAQQR